MPGARRIGIIGSDGMLGSEIMQSNEFSEIGDLFSIKGDITNRTEIRNSLQKSSPDIIIHTAAFTNVEACETNPDKAYAVNTIGTQNIVNYCIGNNVYLVYISSTGIYGSHKKEVYNEFDEVFPTTVHHITKHKGEKMIEKHLSKFLILRTGWLYGGHKEHNKNFVYKRILEGQSVEKMYSDNSQIGNPTYIKDLVGQISHLLKNKCYGVFNCVNEAEAGVSRYDYVQKILSTWGLAVPLKIADPNQFKRVAKVSKNESAMNYKLNLLKLNTMRNWEEALEDYILNDLKFQ